MGRQRNTEAKRTMHILFASVLALLLLGCWSTIEGSLDMNQGYETRDGASEVNTYGVSDGGTVIKSQAVTTGLICPSNNLTQPCSCLYQEERVPGRQTCDISKGWSQCECTATITEISNYNDSSNDPTGNKTRMAFVWKETPPSSSGTCKAGHYSGVFSGFYNSPSMGVFDISFSPVGIPVIGTVEFDLHQIGKGEYFEIRDGAMEGLALILFPFRCDLQGTVVCEGEEPVIELSLKNGVYTVVGMNYYFDGKTVSLYNRKNATFTSGEWAVTEPIDYTVVTRNEDGTADLSNAVYAPLPQLVPGTPPVIDIFVEGGTGAWNAFWVGTATGISASTTTPATQDAGVP